MRAKRSMYILLPQRPAPICQVFPPSFTVRILNFLSLSSSKPSSLSPITFLLRAMLAAGGDSEKSSVEAGGELLRSQLPLLCGDAQAGRWPCAIVDHVASAFGVSGASGGGACLSFALLRESVEAILKVIGSGGGGSTSLFHALSACAEALPVTATEADKGERVAMCRSLLAAAKDADCEEVP